MPEKHLYTADVLSHQPLPTVSTDLHTAVKEYNLLTLECPPASTNILEKIKTKLKKDTTTASVMSYCSTQWPKKDDLPPEIQKYAAVSNDFSVVKGLLVKGLLLKESRIVIPQSLRQEHLNHQHTDHQGVSRCGARACDSAFWPRISQQIMDYVCHCPKCDEFHQQNAEPLRQAPLPNHP